VAVKEIKINNKIISETSRPFIIAEAGVNYYDIAKKENIELIKAAKLMIKEASSAGVDAIKFQAYKAEKIACKHSPAYWDTTKENIKSQYKLFKKHDKFEKKDYSELARYAEENNIIFMSTAFDKETVDFLDRLMPVFKISSSDITNLPLIRYVAQKGKPIFLSTGASTIREIEDAVNTIEKVGNNQIVIMHCILSYPTRYDDANLNMIKYLKEIFPHYLVGYSDHTLPDPNMFTLTTAVLVGARVIEKHFTLDKSLPGNDHYHAACPEDLKRLKGNLEFLQEVLGEEQKMPIKSEQLARKLARRSIVAKIDIPKGAKITKEMLICKRPGNGISPKFLNKVIGKKTKEDIRQDDVIAWRLI